MENKKNFVYNDCVESMEMLLSQFKLYSTNKELLKNVNRNEQPKKT